MVKTGFSFTKFVFLLVICSLTGCQQDEDRIITPPADQVINSEMVDLLQRISLKDGSSDNVIDQASCISLIFPLKVTVNGIEVALNNTDDLGTVEDLLDALTGDDDKLDIQFPINVILENYGEIKVENRSALNELIKNCIEGGSDDDIECLDFSYPFEVALYKTDNQVADIVTITSDKELYHFLAGMRNEDLVSLIFPLSIILSDGTMVTLEKNSDLRDIIKNSEGKCDEDDDDDHNDDDIDEEALTNIITDGEWIITYFFDDGKDATPDYKQFTFTFGITGAFTVKTTTTQFEGDWEIRDDDGKTELRLDIDEDSIESLEENWKVMNFSSTRIKLRNSSGGNPTYLTFERL